MIHKPWAINHISFMIHKWSKSWILRMFTYKSHRMTLVEPGPVVTEFEKKVFEEAEKMDLSETDEETARIFRQIYLRYSHKVFNSIGQTPEEVAEVSVWMSCFFYSLRLPVQLSDRKIGLFFSYSKLSSWLCPKTLHFVIRPIVCTCHWLPWSRPTLQGDYP